MHFNNIKNTAIQKKNAILNKANLTKIEIFHIVMIILGTIFISISCFHSAMWFDECYSVAIANHHFNEIWTIGSHDVHPILYYFMIRIIILLTNNNILCIRLFSCIPLIIMSILGYTFIRKEFGEKSGLLFSFLILFMPTTLAYAGEIRMYTWAMLFVFIMSMYGYKIIKKDYRMKNWIIFSIFSLSSAYTHYYGLITAFIINLYLIIYFIIMSIKNKKSEEKNDNIIKNLKANIISGISQIILYLPWLGAVISQAKSVSGSFWIKPISLFELLEFQFTGNLIATPRLDNYIVIPFTIIGCIYLTYLYIRYWKKSRAAIFSLFVYISLAAIIEFISNILNRPILYPRYFLNVTGLFIFAFAYLMSKEKNKYPVIIFCTLTIIVSSLLNIKLVKTNYDDSNMKPVEYIATRIQPNDIIIVDNNASGFVLAAQIKEKNNKFYFWDRKNWNVEEAYKAYGKTIYSLDELKDFKGRIWALSSNSYDFAETVKQELNGAEILEQERFDVKYELYQYAISVIEVK